MANEVEKKYLPINGEKEWSNFITGSELILQVYLKDEADVPCRVRLHLEQVDIKGNSVAKPRAVLCYKKLNGELEGVPVYEETETALDKNEALKTICENIDTLIIKRRSYVPFHQFTFEIDEYESYDSWVYRKDLWEFDGRLQTIEVEFKTAQEIKEYNSLEKPKWLGLEVTHDHKYKNSNLAKRDKNESFHEIVSFVNAINIAENQKFKP